MDAVTYLRDWTKHYLRNKDMIARQIESLEEKDNTILITRKDHPETAFAMPEIAGIEAFVAPLAKEGYYYLIVLNNEQNLTKVTDAWSTLKHFSHLTIIFVNPFSTSEVKWLIKPSVHDRIQDPASFKTGLLSLFSTVEPITEKELERKT